MMIKKFNLDELSSNLTEPWSPKDIETVDGFVLRVAKFEGEYHWHKHESDDFFSLLREK